MPSGSRRSARRAAALDALKRADGEGPAVPAGERVEDGHVVRAVAGTASARPYRCPGCDHELRASTPHVVAGPPGRPAAPPPPHPPPRRAPGRPGGKVHRSKNAPRYG